MAVLIDLADVLPILLLTVTIELTLSWKPSKWLFRIGVFLPESEEIWEWRITMSLTKCCNTPEGDLVVGATSLARACTTLE